MSSIRFARAYARYPALCLLAALLTVIPAVHLAFKLRVESDFKRLLPAKKPSVIELDRIIQHVGGIGNLAVAIESDDYKATEKFIRDLVPRLESLSGRYIRYVDWNITDIREFYRKNKYLYVDLEDLTKIHDRLAKKIRYEKLRQNPFFIELDEDRVDFNVSDIEDKYRDKTSKYDKYIDGYFFSQDRKLGVLLIKPYGTSTGTKFAKELITRVQEVVDQLNPASYHPSMTVGYSGKYQNVLDEYAQLIRDVLETLALCLLLVSFVIYLYFLRVRAIFLLAVPLIAAVAWTFALTKLQIGYLNSQTAFLGSIIIGNGVNHGIILLARYLEERRMGHAIEEALSTAVRTTWLGTLTAAATTSAAFAALSVSEIKGFSQFGFIGGIGMMLCWVASYTVLPPLLVLSERLLPLVKGNRFVSRQWEFLLSPVGSLVAHSPRLIAGFGLFVAIGLTALAARFLPNSLEYDFSRLKNKPSAERAGMATLRTRVNEVFGENLSPAVMLLQNEKQAPYICDAIFKRELSLPAGERTIDTCRTLRSYLPDLQEKKLRKIRQIRRLLQDKSLNFLKGKYRQEIEEFRAAVNLKKLDLPALPLSIRRNFQELDGTLGRIVYIYPRPDSNLNNGKRLMQFASVLSAVRLPDGSKVSMSGESAIFSDLFHTVGKQGPWTSLYSFLAVAAVVALAFRRFRPIIYVVGGLTLGVLYMFGIQAIIGIKLNFFNFIALPVTFGIGVDYGVNLLQRYRFEGRGSVRRVLGTVGGAILLCSLTTMISYATLLTAENQALVSFGWLGLIGEMACVFAAMVVMPAILHSFDRRHLASIERLDEERRNLLA